MTRDEDKSLDFTESGHEHASAIVRRHRLIERFLTDVLGIPWDEVHEEAERLEHAMSPVLEERMLAAIGDATTCPHGHPIVEGARDRGRAAGRRRGGRQACSVLRFENEAEDLLLYLKDAGLYPGLEGTLARPTRTRWRSTPAASSCSVTRSVAETVSVIADPSPPPRTVLPDQLVLTKDRFGLASGARAQLDKGGPKRRSEASCLGDRAFNGRSTAPAKAAALHRRHGRRQAAAGQRRSK